jgi:hypothetical protein
MSRRKRPQPEHESQHELRLRGIVDEIVSDDSQKQAYLAFAHELMAAGRSSSFVRRPSSEAPDFSMRTKRVVQKWFERGLSGHLLWLIGESVLQGRMY